MELNNLLKRTTLINTDIYGCDDYGFTTYDTFYLDSRYKAVKRSLNNEHYDLNLPTDFAILNKALPFVDKFDLHKKLMMNHTEERKTCGIMLRSAEEDLFSDNLHRVSVVDNAGRFNWIDMHEDNVFLAVRPCVQLEIDAVLAIQNHLSKYKIVNPYFALKNERLDLGAYPCSYVGDEMNYELENLKDKSGLKSTGKFYTGRYNKKRQKLCQYEEFEFKGENFIRVEKGFKGNDGYWLKVEPIQWIIENWQDLPTAINPQGTGTADVIKLRTAYGIMAGIPFYPNTEDKYNHLWQNSTIRGYLNGYNVNNIKNNGSQIYSASRGGDFTQQNFLTEAMTPVTELIRDIQFQKNKKLALMIDVDKNNLKQAHNIDVTKV